MAICYLVCFQVQLTDINCIEAIKSDCTIPLLYFLQIIWIITGFNTIRNVHLDDFSQESCKRTKMQRGKRTFELNCFYERNHIFWIGLSFLFISFLFALLTNHFFIYLCKMIGGLICSIGVVGLFVVTKDHTHTHTHTHKNVTEDTKSQSTCPVSMVGLSVETHVERTVVPSPTPPTSPLGFLISIEGVLSGPMTYDNHPIHPPQSHPHIILN